MSREREHIIFNNEQLQVLYGTLLGDANLCNPNTGRRTNSILGIDHSTKQLGYAMYKARVLGLKTYTRDRYDKRTDKTYHIISAYSASNPTYTEIFRVMYDPEGGGKYLNTDILNALNPLGLAIWYMDDGSTDSEDRRCTLHTEKYSYRENTIIINWFQEKFNLSPYISKAKNNKYFLSFTVEDSYKLVDIIKPYVTPDLEYKTIIAAYKYTPPAWFTEYNKGVQANV